MYADGSLDFGGPACLPETGAATRVKRKPASMTQATANDPIYISSDDSLAGSQPTPPAIQPIKKPKGKVTKKGVAPHQGKTTSPECISIDSSDDDKPNDGAGAHLKHKADSEIDPRPSKKPILAIASQRDSPGPSAAQGDPQGMTNVVVSKFITHGVPDSQICSLQPLLLVVKQSRCLFPLCAWMSLRDPRS